MSTSQSHLAFLLVGWLLWALLAGLAAYQHVAPAWVKKTVTLNVRDIGAVRIVFSNHQPHNEVIYEVKTAWVPLLETRARDYAGTVVTTPYDGYVRQYTWPVVAMAVLVSLLPWVLYCVHSAVRRRATLPACKA